MRRPTKSGASNLAHAKASVDIQNAPSHISRGCVGMRVSLRVRQIPQLQRGFQRQCIDKPRNPTWVWRQTPHCGALSLIIGEDALRRPEMMTRVLF